MRKFLKKHHALFVFIGTVIVFLTFLTKEHYREKYKDLAASVESAENLFLVRFGDAVTLSTVHSSASDVKYLKSIETTKGQKAVPLWDPSGIMNDLRTDLNDLDDVLFSASRLLSKLPENQPERLRELGRQIADARQSSRDFEAWYFGNRKAAEREADKAVSWSTDINNKVASAQLDVDFFKRDILKRAEEVRKQYEMKYERFTKYSYVLYTIGLLFGLIGKIYGVEAIGE